MGIGCQGVLSLSLSLSLCFYWFVFLSFSLFLSVTIVAFLLVSLQTPPQKRVPSKTPHVAIGACSLFATLQHRHEAKRTRTPVYVFVRRHMQNSYK